MPDAFLVCLLRGNTRAGRIEFTKELKAAGKRFVTKKVGTNVNSVDLMTKALPRGRKSSS